MKLFVILAAALVVANAAPQHSFGLARLTANFEPEIPEGCTFLSQTQETVNGVVQGEYSYKDPVGSTVIVTYSLNEDGTDYQETRKIIKAYETDAANLITVGEVVTLITTDLHDVVVEIVRKVVLASTSGYSEALVDEIMIAVQPVVQNAVDNALRVTQYKHLVSKSSQLINGITVELRPFVVEALKREIAIQRPSISVDQVIELVIRQLRVSFESRIRQLVAGYSIDALGNTDALVQRILRELRAEILSAVQAALTANNALSYNAEEITQSILVQITSFVRQLVLQQVELREQNFIQSLVVEIEAKLKPSVINIISATVRAASAQSLAKYEDLVEVIATQLRPVVLEQVRLALRTSAYAGRLDANELTNLLMVKLRPDIAEGVQIQIRLLQEEQARQEAARLDAARREAARREAARLEAARREAARQEAARVEAARREAARLEAARKAEEARREAARVEAARIEAARKAEAARLEAIRIEEARRAEAARLEAIRIEQARRAEQARLAEEARLEAIRIEEARKAEQARLEAIRIEEARQEAIRREAARQEAIRLEAARREAARLAAERAEADRIAAEREITRIVIKQLEPVVLRIIPAAVRNSKEDLDNYKNLADTIIIQLRPVVAREVTNALQLSTKYSNFNVEELTDFLVIEIRPFVEQAIQREIILVKQEETSTLIQNIIVGLNPLIEPVVIKTVRAQSDLSNMDALVATILKALRSVVYDEVTAAIKITEVTMNAEQMTTEIMRQLRGTVVRLAQGVVVTVLEERKQADLVRSVVSQLQPFIVDSVDEVLTGGIDAETAKTATDNFLLKIQSIIRNTVIQIMRTTGRGVSDEASLIKLVLGKLNDDYFLRLIREEVRLALGPGAEVPADSELLALLNECRSQIRAVIVREITNFKQNGVVSSGSKKTIITSVYVYFENVAKQATTRYLVSGQGVGQSEDAIASAILDSLRSQIRVQLETEVAKLPAVKAGYLDGSFIVQELMGQVMAKMRVFIISQVQIYLREQALLATPAPVDKVVSLFGTGKGNSVVVDTKNYHIDYAFDKK